MASVKSFTLCLLTCLFFHSHAATALPQDYTAPNSSTVTLKAGVVVGKQTSIPNRPSNTVAANAYLGIPFAKSPPERFSPPEAAQAWPSPLLAQAVKPACIQQFSPILGRCAAIVALLCTNRIGALATNSAFLARYSQHRGENRRVLQ
jgi:hypothetical protein